MRNYRLTLIGCVFSWFMVGLHLPALQHLAEWHGPAWGVIAATSLLALTAVATLWALLRAPRAGRG